MKSIDEIKRIKKDVEKDLLKIPGVTGVVVGPKIVKGKKTDVLAIRVYVEEKKDVVSENLIPKYIQGVPTDVVQRKFIPHPAQVINAGAPDKSYIDENTRPN